MKNLIIDGVEFVYKEVVLPISRLKGNKKLYVGFDVSIFENRFKGYDEVEKKSEEVKEVLSKEYGKNFKVLSEESFYIENLKLYIDLRLEYIHNFNAYNSKNKFHIDCLNKLIEAGGKEEREIIKNWCIEDVKKREDMVRDKKNYLEIFNYDNPEDLLNQISRVFYIKREYSNEELVKELNCIIRSEGRYESTPSYNKIVTHFNPHIFTNENEFYRNPILRRRQIENSRFLQYKKEHELSTNDILLNFRFNKYVTIYSYFSTSWAKKFYEEYRPTRILDMFGGWGHRYLAFLNVEYIYNDFWKKTYDGVLKIHNFCSKRMNLPDKKFYNEDANNFKFNKIEKYDTVYCCPPYYNFEIYKDKVFKDYNEFLNLWENSVKNSVHDKLRIFAFIIKNIYGNDLVNICSKYGLRLEREMPLGKNINHHYNKNKNVKKIEHLYIMSGPKLKAEVYKEASLFD